jgi:hypothetical protein
VVPQADIITKVNFFINPYNKSILNQSTLDYIEDEDDIIEYEHFRNETDLARDLEGKYQQHMKMQWKKMAEFIFGATKKGFKNRLRLVQEALKLKFDIKEDPKSSILEKVSFNQENSPNLA